MGLFVDLTEKTVVTIENTHPVFEEFPRFKNSKFSVSFHKMSRSREYAIERKHTKLKRGGREEIDTLKISWEKFNETAFEWVGIVNKDGVTIECKEETRKLIFEHESVLVNLLVGALFAKDVHLGEESVELEKNSENSGNGD